MPTRSNALRRKAERLQTEANQITNAANMMAVIADLSDVVIDASDSKQCPGGECKDCPGYVGSPGICVFLRLKRVVYDYYVARERIEGGGDKSPIVGVS